MYNKFIISFINYSNFYLFKYLNICIFHLYVLRNRQINLRKAHELMQMGQYAEAKNLMKRSIDITHEMALKLIKECHKMNIDCIVAPYEADAQLAYLNINKIVDVVITEDSDLILFGCKKVYILFCIILALYK